MKHYEKLGSTDQESFVIEILKQKKNGYYVELGACHPTDNSNTITLEKDFGWTGVSFEIDHDKAKLVQENRTNPCIETDATTFNYIKYFEENNFPKQIDFLQIDIDSGPIGYDNFGRPAGNASLSLLGLIALPLNTYRFSVITFEHDCSIAYRNKPMRDAQREILHSLGYNMIKRSPDEDWWLDPTVLKYMEYKSYLDVTAS